MSEAIMFLVASIYFIPTLAILIVLLWISAEKESLFAPIITGVLLYVAAKGFPALAAFFSNPVAVIGTIVGYLLIGAIWSYAKWYLKLNKVRTKFVEFRDSWLVRAKLPAGYFAKPVDPSNSDNVEAHKLYLASIQSNFVGTRGCKTVQESIDAIRPKAASHKASIMYWIGYWPLSIVWFVISDMVREAAEWIYTRVAGRFARLSERMFSNLA